MEALWQSIPESIRLITLSLMKFGLVLTALLLAVAYMTYAERKVLGWMQLRFGPNRVGYRGLLQPIADGLKLLAKELIFPEKSDRFLFIIAPVLSFVPALAAWVIMPFGENMYIADIDAGLLFVLALTSFAVYGVLLAGWSSNSKYALLGALRAGAQMVAYEIAMGFALVGVVMAAGSLNMKDIVLAQEGNLLHWYWLPMLPLFIVYWISGIAETNRTPFDVVEGESEIVAGFHVEYSGMMFAIFFLAEYANMILISALISTLFLGGWYSPFHGMGLGLLSASGLHWWMLKVTFFLFVYLWSRATFPRFRYDQIMRLGWKAFLPVTIVWLTVESIAIIFGLGPWFEGLI